ncbi:hypothetical protein CR513_01511, partial [Mucuna pruriens]
MDSALVLAGMDSALATWGQIEEETRRFGLEADLALLLYIPTILVPLPHDPMASKVNLASGLSNRRPSVETESASVGRHGFGQVFLVPRLNRRGSSSSSPSSSSGSEALVAMPMTVAKGTSSQSHAPLYQGRNTLSGSTRRCCHITLRYLAPRWHLCLKARSRSIDPMPTKRVCHAAKEGEGDFVYMLETILVDLGVTLPLDHFMANVLRTLRVAPSQLHPNG